MDEVSHTLQKLRALNVELLEALKQRALLVEDLAAIKLRDGKLSDGFAQTEEELNFVLSLSANYKLDPKYLCELFSDIFAHDEKMLEENAKLLAQGSAATPSIEIERTTEPVIAKEDAADKASPIKRAITVVTHGGSPRAR